VVGWNTFPGKTHLLAVAQPHTGPHPSRHQGDLQPIRGVGLGAGQQQQSRRTGGLEADDQLLGLRLGALPVAQPDGHVLAAVEGQRGQFPAAGGSSVQGGRAVADGPVPALQAGASVQAGTAVAHVGLHMARWLHGGCSPKWVTVSGLSVMEPSLA